MTEATLFGKTADGRAVHCFRLANRRGLTVEVLDLGGIIRSISVPDRDGRPVDVALGYDTVQEYEADNAYMGALIGRWANRISGAAFELDGRKRQLAANDGSNHLHGGPGGFHRRFWQAEAAENRIRFSRLSPDGEEGYPGNLSVRAVYALTDDNELVLTYEAESDRDTIVNLTNHSYFNLNGHGDILGHELTLAADFFSEADEALIPSGRLLPVDGGPFDFRKAKSIGRDINAADRQLVNGRGYDHNFVLKLDGGGPVAVAAAGSGITLSVRSSLPGMQFYSGNFLTVRRGKAGQMIGPRSGFCLETQFFPGSINQPDEPRPILKKGALYRHSTTYTFTVQ